MLGTLTDLSRSVSRSNSIFGGRGGSSESVSEQRRPLLLPQELKELGRDKEIIVLENTKPILADRICYWRDPEFVSRVMEAPSVPAMNLARSRAVVERRLRDLQHGDVDPEGAGLIGMPVEYLEVLEAWDPRELPPSLADISEEDAVAYVERHFMLLGVPAEKVRQARRRLSVADLDAAELRPVEPSIARRGSSWRAASNVAPIQGGNP
jgi:type IV secretion system protein VirD4